MDTDSASELVSLPVGSFDRVDASRAPDQFADWMDLQRRLATPDLERLAPNDGERVLDLGCGPGNDMAPMADAVGGAGLAIGLDRSATMGRRAAARVPAAACVVGDGQARLAGGPFDRATSDAVDDSAITPEQADACLWSPPR